MNEHAIKIKMLIRELDIISDQHPNPEQDACTYYEFLEAISAARDEMENALYCIES